MKDKLPSPLTIEWCRKNKKVIQEMDAKFDKKKNPSHWHRKGDADYWKTKVAAHRIRAQKLNRLPAWADEQKIEQVFRDAPDGLEIDHIVPISGELVSGLHVENNLQYLTTKENASKHNKFNPRRFIINRASISLV
jgi:5-methylcytosine-specific restriction endonuclease McrA